jgi:hypothetical protein
MQIRKLRAQIQQRSPLVLFLGAGASVESGGRTAHSVAVGISEQIYGRRPTSELIAEYTAQAKRQFSFENVLDTFGSRKSEQRRLLLQYFQQMKPSNGYRLLAEMLRFGYFNNIVLTTNFDTMLEDAFSNSTIGDQRVSIRVITGEDVTDELRAPNNEILLVKLHGDIGQGKQNTLKMTMAETAHLTRSCESLVARLYAEYGMAVIGYRAKDLGVQTSMMRSGPSHNGIYWIAKDVPNSEHDQATLQLLSQSNSAGNIIAATFDEFMERLGQPFVEMRQRAQWEHQLNGAWRALDRARDFGESRISDLATLKEQIGRILANTDLDECRALHEFTLYEIDRSGEAYRLQSGVQMLENAIARYAHWMTVDETIEFEYSYLVELLNLFLTGEQIPGGRMSHLDKLIEQGRNLYARIPHADILRRSRIGLVVAEALKEKAMVTEVRADNVALFGEARQICLDCIKVLSGNLTEEGCRLLGTAYRHGAVTFELEGDLQKDGDNQRRALYENWRKWSNESVQVLTSINEDRVCGYALLNLGASKVRLVNEEHNDTRKEGLLSESRADLEQGRAKLQKLDDARGLGWSYIHLCANLRESLKLRFREEDKAPLLVELESAANRAVAMLKRGNDELAQGLALKELGDALYFVYCHSDSAGHIKLSRATAALNEAVQRLAKTGYYRGEGETYAALSKCHFASWKQSHDEDEFVRAFDVLVKGLLSTARDLGTTESLRSIYEKLDDQLQELL